jgi:hypothetical protein
MERDTAFDLRTITGPILLHLLRKELPRPRVFMARCRLTLRRFKKRIDPRFPRELVEIAALPLWVYVNLAKRIGKDKALEIMRIAILTGGIARWNFEYGAAARRRTFDNLCDEELEVNRVGVTRWNTLEVVERTEHRFEIKITRCLYHELATSLGVPEITPIVCQIDNAAFNSYLPDEVLFHRRGPGHRIADGSKECTFVWEHHARV